MGRKTLAKQALLQIWKGINIAQQHVGHDEMSVPGSYYRNGYQTFAKPNTLYYRNGHYTLGTSKGQVILWPVSAVTS